MWHPTVVSHIWEKGWVEEARGDTVRSQDSSTCVSMCAVWAWGPGSMSAAPTGQPTAPQWQEQGLLPTSRPCLPQPGDLCHGERRQSRIPDVLYVVVTIIVMTETCRAIFSAVDERKKEMTAKFLLASKVNCNDDLGILMGKWSGSYTDGVRPTDWSGSADILHRWVSSDCNPVRYGQCWVFASVLCTGTYRHTRGHLSVIELIPQYRAVAQNHIEFHRLSSSVRGLQIRTHRLSVAASLK